jgi:LemA protein
MHEKATLEKVTEARANAMNNHGHDSTKTQVENMLSAALKSIFAISENYPDLKANANFLELQNELANTENKIQASRRFYNSMVLSLNTKVETFPSNLIAGMFGFKKENFFELDEAEKAAASASPKVSF